KKNEITKGIFSVLEADPSKSFNYKQIASKLGIEDTTGRNLLIKRLGQLNEKKRIEEIEKGKYKIIPSKNYFEGIIEVTGRGNAYRSEEHTSELQSRENLVCRLLLEKKNT